MARYIDGDALLDWYDAERRKNFELYRSASTKKAERAQSLASTRASDKCYFKIMELIGTADVEEVRRGEWIQESVFINPRCSLCGKYEVSGEKKKYCSTCGAKMDGGKE